MRGYKRGRDEDDVIETGILSKRLKYVQEQDANTKAAQQKAFPPSYAAKPLNILSHQRVAPVLNGRPFDQTGSPIGLYHPIFNIFEELEGPIPVGIRLDTQRYIELSADVYPTEAKRMEAIKTVLESLLGANILVVGVKSDGAIVANCGSQSIYTIIIGLKNEIGIGDWDPFLRCSFGYQRYWSSPAFSELRDKSYCPSMLLVIAGPWLCVCGAVYGTKPIVQPLTSFLYTGSESQQTCIERAFHCLRTAITSLGEYYVGLPPLSRKEDVSGFPFIREYDKWGFSYEKTLGGSKRLVFKVKEGDSFRVVKFVTQYNETAHRLLAEDHNGVSFAPILRYVSSGLYGGRRMVVMDYVEGETLGQEKLSGAQYDQIKEALDRLHHQGLVFGDLRGPNIIIKDDRAILIDLDWCGKEEEATYPLDLNTNIQWAEGIGPGLPMKKEHDYAMLEKLRQHVQ